ncbi:MAG: class I SAM-dependent methyltransferase, partial [Methanocellales archaeon]|nr:class I SAM-dependent methyltransferase [Methanocellales archaeon]
LGKKNFEDVGMQARFLLEDIFRLNEKEKYDLVFSDGLIEHFSGKRRRDAFKKHVDAAKKGGYIMIFVPKSNALYWIVRTFLKKIGAWMFTEEPFTEKELTTLCDEHDLKVIKMQTWLTDLGVLAIKTKE